MRLLTLAIALLALIGVAYISLVAPSRAAVFSDTQLASASYSR